MICDKHTKFVRRRHSHANRRRNWHDYTVSLYARFVLFNILCKCPDGGGWRVGDSGGMGGGVLREVNFICVVCAGMTSAGRVINGPVVRRML